MVAVITSRHTTRMARLSLLAASVKVDAVTPQGHVITGHYGRTPGNGGSHAYRCFEDRREYTLPAATARLRMLFGETPNTMPRAHGGYIRDNRYADGYGYGMVNGDGECYEPAWPSRLLITLKTLPTHAGATNTRRSLHRLTHHDVQARQTLLTPPV